MTEAMIEALVTRYRLESSERNLQRLPLELEEASLRKVQEGRVREITALNYEEDKEHIGPMANNSKRSLEYGAVASITLCCRAAIDGGAKPEECYDLSDVLLQQLEKTTSPEEILELSHLATVMFAKQVQNARRLNQSYVIEQCKIYISKHIFQKILISDLAAYVGLHPNYLSQLFSKSQKITLRDYIQREKITVSCNLLRHSDQPIASIALYMGYQSQSKFTQAFEKWMSMTPSVYRHLHYRSIYDENT